MSDANHLPNHAPATRREIFAWAMYDWANSAYSTLSITVLVYYIKDIVFPKDIYGNWGAVVFAWGISLSMFVAAILSPIVGAMADRNGSKRRWLATTALLGAACAAALGLIPSANASLVVLFFFFASLLFELSLGVYNGFLPEIADETTMNRVSAWGYGLGYIGGAVALALALLVLKFGHLLAIPDQAAGIRIGLLIMGLWWGVFSLPTIWILRDRHGPPREPLAFHRAAYAAFGEVKHTLRNVRTYRALTIFLVAFLFYNDGMQTVISQSSTFALMELNFEAEELIYLILLVQIVAMPGALAVGKLADSWGQKPTLMLCLAVWVAIVATAYFFVSTKAHFWSLAVVLALVLGGTQSVSRAIMGLMTPRAHTAEFFGFFNLSGKATSFLGTATFGLMIQLTDSARYAVLSLLVFFLIGSAMASRVDVAAGKRQAEGT